MCFRFQVSICLLCVCLAAGIACDSPHALGDDPPPRVMPRAEWEARIEAALDAKGEWAFEDVPLKKVCAAIQEKLGIDVVLDGKALEDYGIDSGTPITRSVGGISNRSLLRLILSDLELTYTLRYGALWITTPDSGCAGLITKVYPVGDLLVRETSVVGGVPGYEFLIQAIMSSISPDAWDQVGGPGSIEGIYETLVVSQTEDIHEEIEQFLTAYSDIIAVDRGAGQPQPTVVMLGPDTLSLLYAALDKPFTGEFKDTGLSEAVGVISAAMNIPIVIDTRALEDFAIDSSAPVNGKFTATPLRFALFRILNELELTYTMRDEVLLISTPEACEAQMEIRLYPVRDLVQIASALPSALPSGRPGADCDFDSLMQVIAATIGPDTWDEVGGPGAIEPLLPAPTLLIAQSQQIHEEISELLVKLRAAKQLKAAGTAAAEDVDPAALLVRTYPIQAAFNAPDEIAKLVMRASEPGTWDDDAGTFVQGLGMSIVVKHSANGHRQVQKLLSQLGVWPSVLQRGKGLGGGGGFAAPGASAQPAMGSGGGGYGGGFF